MIHGEENAQTMDEWLKEAEACPLKEIRGFAKYIRKDRNAVEQTCRTAFNNGLLEGTVNKSKAFKRNRFNKAGPAVLRAKLLMQTETEGMLPPKLTKNQEMLKNCQIIWFFVVIF